MTPISQNRSRLMQAYQPPHKYCKRLTNPTTRSVGHPCVRVVCVCIGVHARVSACMRTCVSARTLGVGVGARACMSCSTHTRCASAYKHVYACTHIHTGALLNRRLDWSNTYSAWRVALWPAGLGNRNYAQAFLLKKIKKVKNWVRAGGPLAVPSRPEDYREAPLQGCK